MKESYASYALTISLGRKKKPNEAIEKNRAQKLSVLK